MVPFWVTNLPTLSVGLLGPMRSHVPRSVCIPILRLLFAFSITLWIIPGGPTWFMLGLPGMWFALATVPTRFPMCGPMVVMRLSLRFLLSVMLWLIPLPSAPQQPIMGPAPPSLTSISAWTTRLGSFRGCAIVLDLWPNAHELDGTLERAHIEATPKDPDRLHTWTWTGTNWQCTCCFRTSCNPKRVSSRCNALPLLFLNAVQHNRGHHLWIGQIRGKSPPAGLFLYCARCACHGTPKSVKGLLHLCAEKPRNDTYARFARNFSQGIHPNGSEFLRPWPLGCFSHATASLAQVPVAPVVPHVRRWVFDDADGDGGFPEIGEAQSD